MSDKSYLKYKMKITIFYVRLILQGNIKYVICILGKCICKFMSLFRMLGLHLVLYCMHSTKNFIKIYLLSLIQVKYNDKQEHGKKVQTVQNICCYWKEMSRTDDLYDRAYGKFSQLMQVCRWLLYYCNTLIWWQL